MPYVDEFNDVGDKLSAGRMSRPVLLGILCVAVVISLLAALGVASSARGDFVVGTSAASSSSAAIENTQEAPTGTVPDATESSASQPCIYVVGAVKKPGVYTVPEGSRIADAVEAAGGFAKGADKIAVNLARPVVDGEQITIPEKGDGQSVASSASDGNTSMVGSASPGISSDGKVNINNATSSELETLPGIGPTTAAKIIASRESEGPFTAPEELKRVSGIGDKKYEAIADAITI